MTKTPEDLIRELESSGVLEDRPPRPLSRPPQSGVQRRTQRPSALVLLVIAALVVAVVGSVPFGSLILYPFSLFVTLVHESAHATAAVVSGGSVTSLGVSSDLSGLTVTRGGMEAVIAPAGYLGATLAGAALLTTPLRFARWALGTLAFVPITALALFHVASIFTAVWCVIFAIGFGFAAWKLPWRAVVFLQVLLGVETGLNALRDLTTLIFISGSDSHLQTDADNMSRALFFPPMVWAGLWAVLSAVILTAALFRVSSTDWRRLRG